MEKRAFTLTETSPADVAWKRTGETHFDDVSVVSAIALVGYINPSLSETGNGFGRSMDLS